MSNENGFESGGAAQLMDSASVTNPYERQEDLLPSCIDKVQFLEDRGIDESGEVVKYIMYCIIGTLIFFFLVLPMFGGASGESIKYWTTIFSGIDPHFFAGMGVGLSIALPVVGACWGILLTGSSMVGAGVRTPSVSPKNLISVIFCEAIGIYGLIVTIVIAMKYRYYFDHDLTHKLPDFMIYQFAAGGYVTLAVGLGVGVSCCVAAMAIGTIGSSTVMADAADHSLFVKMMIVEIFAEAIGVFALFIGIVFQFLIVFEYPWKK